MSSAWRTRTATSTLLSFFTFLWIGLVLIAVLAALMGRAHAEDPFPGRTPPGAAPLSAAPQRIAGSPMNLLVPGMETPARDLLGWPVYAPGLERIGTVESVFVDVDGKLAGAVIWMRPSATATARSVALQRRDFVVQIGKVAVSSSGEALRERPAFRYASASDRGGILPAGVLMAALETKAEPVAIIGEVPVVAVASENPEFSSTSLIGAPVRNLADESLGSVADLVLDDKGRMQAIMVVVHAGLENRPVRLDSSEVRVVREEGGLTVRTALPRVAVAKRNTTQQALVR